MSKTHPPDLHKAATDAANVAGMVASGQPWQEDCGGASTADMLAEPHPSLAPPAKKPRKPRAKSKKKA